MATDLSRVPAQVRERVKELEEELKEGGSSKKEREITVDGVGGCGGVSEPGGPDMLAGPRPAAQGVAVADADTDKSTYKAVFMPRVCTD